MEKRVVWEKLFETWVNMAFGTDHKSPLSEAQFLSWKRQKGLIDGRESERTLIDQDADASSRRAEAARKRAEDIAAGVVQMNGRELFLHEPWVFDNSQY